MKRFCLILIAVFTAVPFLIFAQNWDETRKKEIATIEDATQKISERVKAFQRFANFVAGNRSLKKDELYRLADLLMKNEELTGKDIASVQNAVCRAAVNAKNQQKRMDAANLVIASEKTSAAEKVAAVRDLTEALVILGRPDEALTVAKNQLSFPKLSDSALYAAYGNIGRVHSMCEDMNAAIAAYREIVKADSSPAAVFAMNTLIADEYLYFKELDKAVQVWRDAANPLKEAEYLQKIERAPEARLAAKCVLDNPEASERDKITALYYFFTREPETREIRKKYPELCNKFDGLTLYFRQLVPALRNGDYDYALEMAEILLGKPSHKESFETNCMKIIALAALNRAGDAAVSAEEALKNCPKFKPEQKFRLRLLAELLKTPYKEGDVKRIFDAVSKEFESENLTLAQKSGELQYVGRTLAAANIDRAVMEVQALYDSFFVARPKNVYQIPFSETPLLGYADWVQLKNKPSPQLLKWKYGGSMDFLVTDVSTGGRGGGIGSEDSKGEMKYTELYSVCDENGIHFILRAWDDRASEVELGTLGGGCYEIYLSPGENEPYHCFLPEIGSDAFGVWHTTYPNEKSRRIEGTPRSERIFHKDGYTNYFFITWDAFYDKLPEKPERFWEADFVHWGRQGGYSWNALESIHSRSTWGKLSFSIPADGLRKITTKQIMKALKKYREAKDLNVNGALVIWRDPVLGDPEFYDAELKAYEEKLDSYAKMVGAPDWMKPETIEFLWKTAVPEWNEIGFHVAEKRRIWLENKMFEKKGI